MLKGQELLPERTYYTEFDSTLARIYNFDFDLNPPVKNGSAQRLAKLYRSYWQYLADEQSVHKREFDKERKKTWNYDLLNDNEQKLARLSESLLQLRYENALGNLISGLFIVDDIGKYFSTCSLDSSNKYSMLYWGLYNYYFAHAKEQSIIVRSILPHWTKPSKTTGMALLRSLVNCQSRFVATEARYFLMRALWEIEQQPKEAELLARGLMEEYPNNLMYQWFWLRILVDTKGEAASKVAYQHCLDEARRNRIEEGFILLFIKKMAKEY